MPRYYFHLHGDRFDAADLTGKDCPALECAQKTAHRIAGELIMNSMTDGQMPMDITIAVEDEELRPVLTLPSMKLFRISSVLLRLASND